MSATLSPVEPKCKHSASTRIGGLGARPPIKSPSMRRSLVFAILLAFTFLAIPRATSAETVGDVLRRQTQELADAIGTGSAAVWDRYLDPEVRYVDESGKVLTKKKMLDDLKPLPQGVSGSLKVTDFDVAVHGGVAVATYVDDEHEDFHGHKLHCQYRVTDTWIRTAKGWRLIAAQVLALRADPPSARVAAALHDEYCGTYTLTSTISYVIRKNGDRLEGRRSGREAEELLDEAPDVLFVPGRPRYRYVFLRGAGGMITGLAERREAWDLVWKRTGS